MINQFIKRTLLFRLLKALSKRERFAMFLAITVFIASGVTYGVLLVNARTYQSPARGGEFTEGVVGQPVFINPIIPTTDVDRDIASIVFSSVKQVADSIKRSDDGKTWDVRLKENVFWHDGEKLTADDIIFTLNTVQDPESHSPLYASFQGVSAERVSELEVRFVLQNGYAFFANDHLKNLRIIPKHIFNDIPIQNIKLSSYGLKPIGSGPYKVDSFSKGSDGIITSFKLISNKNYFDGAPNIKTLTFNFYKNNKDLIKAYNSGQIDAFGLSTAEPLTENNVRVRNKTYYLNSPRYYAAFINQSLAPEELQDVDVRRALSGTVNRKRIIGEVFDSKATALYGPTIKSSPIKDFNTDLINGLELNLTVPDETFLVKTADIMKENWESYGAKVNVLVLPIRTIQEEVLKNSDYEILLFGNITKENQDLFAFWHSSRRFYPDQNLSLYQNKKLDTLLESYRKTFNTDERVATLQKISDIIANNVPAIFLYSPQYVYVTTPRLGGFDETVIINTADNRFNDIGKWFVNTKRVFGSPPEK